ncbi:MAG: type II toxin-antitoxin system VapC family toxin [Candidatus Brocadiales bacterium]
MTFYMDSCALVKAYALEEGSEGVIEILNTEEDIFLSKVAFAEILSSLRRKNFNGELKDKGFQGRRRHFEEDWRSFYVIELSDDVLSVLKSRVIKHPLRALDAIHLASAIWAGSLLETRPTLVCADASLNEAAKSEGFKVFNPSRP